MSNAQVLITSMNMLGLLCRSSPPVLKFTCPASGVSVQQLHLLVRAVNLSVKKQSVTEQEISLLIIIITSFFFFVLISSHSLVKSSDPWSPLTFHRYTWLASLYASPSHVTGSREEAFLFPWHQFSGVLCMFDISAWTSSQLLRPSLDRILVPLGFAGSGRSRWPTGAAGMQVGRAHSDVPAGTTRWPLTSFGRTGSAPDDITPLPGCVSASPEIKRTLDEGVPANQRAVFRLLHCTDWVTGSSSSVCVCKYCTEELF